MLKKILAALAVAAMLLIAAPAAANAVQYTNGSPCRFDVNVVRAGDTATLICVPGTWAALETVDWTVTGSNGTTIRFASFPSVVGSAHFAKTTAADGSDVLTITLPAKAVGLYSVVGHGRVSNHTCPTSLTVLPADNPGPANDPTSSSSSGLAATGSVVGGWIAWTAAGLLVLGLIVLLIAVRRRRARSN